METPRLSLTSASSSVTFATTSGDGLLGSVTMGAAKLKSLHIKQSKVDVMTSHTEQKPSSFNIILAELQNSRSFSLQEQNFKPFFFLQKTLRTLRRKDSFSKVLKVKHLTHVTVNKARFIIWHSNTVT